MLERDLQGKISPFLGALPSVLHARSFVWLPIADECGESKGATPRCSTFSAQNDRLQQAETMRAQESVVRLERRGSSPEESRKKNQGSAPKSSCSFGVDTSEGFIEVCEAITKSQEHIFVEKLGIRG